MSSHITNRLSQFAIGKRGSAFLYQTDAEGNVTIVRKRSIRKKTDNGRVQENVAEGYQPSDKGWAITWRRLCYHVTKGFRMYRANGHA